MVSFKLYNYLDLILPPHSLKGKLEGENILLDWKSSQNNRSYVLCYRICSKASQKDNTLWMEIDVGSFCILEKPVTFFIGDISSRDSAREIKVQVKAAGMTERSIASNTVTLDLKDYWKSLMISKASSSVVEMEEVMIEGESNPAMMTGEAEIEELEAGETMLPKDPVVNENPKIERKSSKFKIRRDFTAYQKDANVDKAQSSIKKDANVEKAILGAKMKDIPSEADSFQKIKHEQLIPKPVVGFKQKEHKNDDSVPRKKFVKSQVSSMVDNYDSDKSDKSSEPMVRKSENVLKYQKPLVPISPSAVKDSTRKDDFIGTYPVVSVVSERLQLKLIEKKNDMLSIDKNVKQSDIESDSLVTENFPSVNSVEKLHEMLMDPSKPMYYNLKYGTDIQVLYDGDWWMAKVMFYAYDQYFNLFIKIHFPAWKKSEDRYVPLKDGDRAIRDTLIPVKANFPKYKSTNFKFDLSSKGMNAHHGVTSSETEECLKKGYILKPIEENPVFLDD